MANVTVMKLDCAKRQLEMAIVLFFEYRDPVAIHTLACAAYQLVFDINKHHRGKRMFLKDRYLDGKPPATISDINRPQNFFKHADRGDHDDALEFNPANTGAYIVDACRTYTELTGDSPLTFSCFRTWLTCSDPSLFDFPPEKQAFLLDILRLHAANDRDGFVERFLAETGPSRERRPA